MWQSVRQETVRSGAVYQSSEAMCFACRSMSRNAVPSLMASVSNCLIIFSLQPSAILTWRIDVGVAGFGKDCVLAEQQEGSRLCRDPLMAVAA